MPTLTDKMGMKKTIFLLMMILIYSCNGGGGGSSTAGAPDSSPGQTQNIKGAFYSIPVWIHRDVSYVVELNFDCGQDDCIVDGELVRYYGSTSLANMPFTGTLQKNGDKYSGQISINNPPFVANYNMILGADFKVQSINNGTKCMNTTTEKTHDQFNDFKATFSPSDVGAGLLDFSVAGDLSTCN